MLRFACEAVPLGWTHKRSAVRSVGTRRNLYNRENAVQIQEKPGSTSPLHIKEQNLVQDNAAKSKPSKYRSNLDQYFGMYLIPETW